MPELPEVETVRRGLQLLAKGRCIADVEVFAPRVIRRHVGDCLNFCEQLRGSVFTGFERRGKFMWGNLDTGAALIIHLGMTGQIRPLSDPGESVTKHERVRVVFASDSGGDSEPSAAGFRFIDQRMFGALSVCGYCSGEGLSDGVSIPLQVSHIAPDVFDPDFDVSRVAVRMRRSRAAIKNVLLNQHIVAGFGNIYADEALARVGVHGLRPAQSLAVSTICAIIEEGRKVMRSSLEFGGTTFDGLYVSVNGEFGDFARQLRVYGRQGEPCRVCSTVINTVVIGGRTHHYCPVCQPVPSGMVA